MSFQGGEEITGQHIIGLGAQVMLIEPLRFLDIKAGSGLVDAIEGEHLNQFLFGKQFLLGSRVPPQQRQEINDGLGQVAPFAIATTDFT